MRVSKPRLSCPLAIATPQPVIDLSLSWLFLAEENGSLRDHALAEAGFIGNDRERQYLPGLKIASYHCRGTAAAK